MYDFYNSSEFVTAHVSIFLNVCHQRNPHLSPYHHVIQSESLNNSQVWLWQDSPAYCCVIVQFIGPFVAGGLYFKQHIQLDIH